MLFLDVMLFQEIYVIGKDEITKSPKLIDICCEVAPVFYNVMFSKSNIQEVDEQLFFGLYNQLSVGSLNKWRQKIFMEKVAGT